MDSESWITGHNHAFDYLGGVTDIIVPDNLRTGVTKNKNHDIVLNTTYREMAEHYGAIILPARVRAPKDKASVEGNVGALSTWIIGALRNTHCFTISDLNHEIRRKLDDFNNREFTKRQGSRRTAFEEEEKFALKPLPSSPYKMAVWKKANVQLNYHVTVENMFYSVPYEYIQHVVEIRVTKDLIEIYFRNMRIATHKRLCGKFGQFSTNKDHMPDNHKTYIDHTPESAIEWAEGVGEATKKVVLYILEHYQVEKQALKSIMALKNLGKKYSKRNIEEACEAVLTHASSPTIKGIQTILNARKRSLEAADKIEEKLSEAHGFTRGASYYGGK